MNEKDFFKRNTFEIMLFAWVKAVKYNLPSITNEKAIDQFYKFFSVTETQFIKKESARVLVYKFEQEYNSTQKAEPNDKAKA